MVPSLSDVGPLALHTLSYTLGHRWDESLFVRISLRLLNNAPLEHTEGVLLLFNLAQPVLHSCPHVLLWVQIW